ncbi:TerB N-terminal domain-containing protein [Saccharibacillus kuerlensis]|uniref:TerB N-terminal domain-containing protein n=1 Tax=Saccharibacillus kuerlensis TaxID=459527 RepID=A0ABQ2L2H6_9BACL|nr:TerB N-terminal domain-containing protein [Saccharibacillus kuerlensis]GGO00414.1 hypothetical protein GCM10010969_21580 [Saccharibacillus kuerlensis]
MSDFFARPAAYSYDLYLSADGGGKFWLSATDGEGPVLLRDALIPLPRYMLPEYRLNREEAPIRASRLLVVRDTLLRAIEREDAPGLYLHMDDKVELAMMADPDQEPDLTFFLDGERSSLIGRLPEGALYLEPGWFGRFGDAGYELIDMPGFEEDDLDWIGRRIGPDEWEELLVRVIPSMRERRIRVRSEIEYLSEPAGSLEILDCGEDYAAVRVFGGEQALRMRELNGYVLTASWISEKSAGTESGEAKGEGIPEAEKPEGLEKGKESRNTEEFKNPAESDKTGKFEKTEESVRTGRSEKTEEPEESGKVSDAGNVEDLGVRLVESLPVPPDSGESAEGAFVMRPALEGEIVQRLFGCPTGGTARGDELAEFARLSEREWGSLVKGEAAAKFRDLHRLYDTADWSWSLRGGPVVERGVGVVRAEPVLSAGGRQFTAAELTGAWSEGRRYLRLEDGWIDLEAPEFARSLREHGAGGGSAGLITAGFSYRQRIGLPGEGVAGELLLVLEGPKPAKADEERPALAHLRYLAGWGMNGGLHGGAERWLAELGEFAEETLAASPDCRLVVAGRRELLTALAETAGAVSPLMLGAEGAGEGRREADEIGKFENADSSDVTHAANRIIGTAEAVDANNTGNAGHASGNTDSLPAADGGIALPPRGSDRSGTGASGAAEISAAASSSGEVVESGTLILAPFSLLQRADFEEKLQADILLVLEPDAAVRSDETRLFSRLDAAEARVRIAVYSAEGHMNDARVRAVQIRLLKLYDSLTRSFLLLEPDRGAVSPGARPPLRDVPDLKLPSWRKGAGGMAEMFVDEPEAAPKAPVRRGMAIPPRPSVGMTESDPGAAEGQEADTESRFSQRWGGASVPVRPDFSKEKPEPDSRDTRSSHLEPDSRDMRSSHLELDSRDTRLSRPEPDRKPSPLQPKRRPQDRGGLEARPVRPVQQQSAEREFVRRARENANRTESEVPFVPFSSYWPTYAAMKPEQEQWYFYWRSQFRSGEKVETDLSYLFIYIYELINGIGWEQPQEGMEAMIRVWESYRARFRRLDGYMADWVREFALVHALDLPESTALEQTSGQLKGELLDLELARRFEETPADLTWELIARLSDYDMTTSRFYKEAGKKTMPRVLPHIVRAIDDYLVRTRGIRLTGLFREADIRITERYLFRSAVYDPELYGRTFLVRAPKLGLHAQLRDFMTQLVRQTENELRARFKFGGRLRGIKLDPEIAEVIAEAAEREFLPPEDRVLPEPPKRPEVKLDLEELEKLRRDSEEVLRMLTGELMTGGSSETERQANVKGEEFSEKGTSTAEEAFEQQDSSFGEVRSRSEEPQDGIHSEAADAAVEEPIAGEMTSESTIDESTIDESIIDEYEGFEMLELPEDVEESWSGEPVPGALSFDPAAEPGGANGGGDRHPRAEAEETSSRQAEGDLLSCAEGQTEEVDSGSQAEGRNRAEESAPTVPAADTVEEADWDVSELDEDWQAFAAAIGSAERDMVRAVLLGLSETNKMSIAGASGELPETMIDRINEAAMETIGDLLIDGGEVLEEYIPYLEGLRGN